MTGDDHEGGDRHECPVPECGIEMPGATELKAHLEWDHRFDEREAEKLV